ncbi:MAG: hypothetical protein LBI77_00510 [Puniceicoccales bacterium]|jgi:hypothetical protein|nr:hypothetical protein [Puniceicoccales bacterium]
MKGLIIWYLFLATFISQASAAEHVHCHSKFTKRSPEQNIPLAKVRPCVYNGRLKRCQSSFFNIPFFRAGYEYCITDEKGETIAFLDISNLAIGTSLYNFCGRNITVNGPSSPHKYRGVMVIKAQNIPSANP